MTTRQFLRVALPPLLMMSLLVACEQRTRCNDACTRAAECVAGRKADPYAQIPLECHEDEGGMCMFGVTEECLSCLETAECTPETRTSADGGTYQVTGLHACQGKCGHYVD